MTLGGVPDSAPLPGEVTMANVSVSPSGSDPESVMALAWSSGVLVELLVAIGSEFVWVNGTVYEI